MVRYVMPVVIALLWAGACSFIPEPHRRRFNAVVVGGAGAAYISGGSFGLGELAFTALMTVIAYIGLRSWTFIGSRTPTELLRWLRSATHRRSPQSSAAS